MPIVPYDIEKRILKYVEDSSQVPLTHELINEAIQFLCQATEKGKDWSFLKTSAELEVSATGATAVVTLPSDFRSIIHIEDGTGYQCELHGRDIIIKASSASTMPTTIKVEYYRSHPLVCALSNGQYSADGSDAEWTPTNPPSTQILLPDEAADAIVYETLMLFTMHEIEVSVSTQFAEKVVQTTLEYLRANYALQIDYRTPITEDGQGAQTEDLTVGWLVDYGKVLTGGERDELQLIALVNRIAIDFADKLKLRGEQRPKIRNKVTDALPTFGDVAYNNATGVMEPSKKIPAEYWKAAMKYYCLQAVKQLDELTVAEFNAQMEALKDLFFYSVIDARAPIGTDGQGRQTENLKVGWLANYINSVLGGERSETQLINIVNDVAAEFANKLKLRGAQRPDRKNALSDDLPTFGDVAYNKTTGQIEAAKKIPASFWIAGAKYQCLRILGKLDEVAVAEYNTAVVDLGKLLFYSVIDSKTPVTDAQSGAQTENLTVAWLANYINSLLDGEYSDFQLVNLVNRIASEFADKLRLRRDQRPKIRNAMADALPTFGGVGGFSMDGNTAEKEIPEAFWRGAARYHCARIRKELDEAAVMEYRDLLEALASLFYSLKTSGVYDYSTYGGMMDYLRSIWGSQQNDMALWAALNQTIADVMRGINVNELLTCETYETTNEHRNDFTLPNDFKNAMKIMLDGKHEIIGRSFASRGRVPSEQQLWSFPGDYRRRWGWRTNFFSFVGDKIHFRYDLPENHTFELWYYPKHVWPYKIQNGVKVFDLEAKIPIDPDLLATALQARVALEQKDFNSYKVHTAAYNEALAAYNEAQNRSIPEDHRFIAATPTVDYILACNTFGFGEF